MFLVQFLENPIIKLIGAVLLCIICVKLYVEIRNNQPKKSQQHSGTTFWHAIWLIIVADVSMSLDNVLAVSAVIDHSAWLLIPSIIISVILMTTLASQLQKRIKRYPLIQWIGFTMIVIIAIKLLMASVSMLLPVSYYNIVVSSTMMIMMIAAMVLHHYYLTPLETKQLHPRFKHHASLIIMILLTIIALFIGYGDFIIMRL
jgi:predicted tellurium resistance membrane protein TerC